MGFYLLENPPARAQYRSSRRAAERGVIVVHTAESTPDFIAFDGGAEAVARFIAGRTDAPGSYHELADSDSSVPMVPDHCEAFGDGTGSNPWAWHLSVATRADVWPLAPQRWRDGAVEQAAQAAAGYAHRLHARTGIVIPARRITRAESEAGVPGFISHGERDPGRRHDPGAEFPWPDFLARYAELTADLNGAPSTPALAEMEQTMAYGTVYRFTDNDTIAFGAPGIWQPTGNPDQASFYVATANQPVAVECNAVQWAWAQALALSARGPAIDLDALATKVEALGDQVDLEAIAEAVADELARRAQA